MSTFYDTCYNQTQLPVKFCTVTEYSQCEQMNLAVAVTPKITAMASMLAVSLIIYRVIVTPARLRKTYDRLIFWMSVMNFFGSLGFFLGEWTYSSIDYPASTTSPFCNFQGWLLQINSAVFWYNGCLATNFVLRIRHGWNEERILSTEPFLHIIAWFYPVVTSFIALGLGMYGMSGPWCWITAVYNWTRFAFFFVPLWVIMIYTTICMILIVVTVKRSDDQNALYKNHSHPHFSKELSFRRKRKLGRQTKEVATQAVLYVSTFLLTWIFGTANRIQNWVSPSCSVFALVWLHSFFVPTQAFFNFLVYIYPRIKKKVDEDNKLTMQQGQKTFKANICDKLSLGLNILFGKDSRERDILHTRPSEKTSHTGEDYGKELVKETSRDPGQQETQTAGTPSNEHPNTITVV